MDDTPQIRIFKPGRFTSVEGTEASFSEADLEGVAAAYDPASDPAPLVIGHPKLDAPAFGWVKSLTVEDGHLVAHPDPEKLEPAFAEAVRAGRYSKVSAQFYAPDHHSNPKPGSFYLKHIGFLGAAAPAVKGLGMVSFAEEGGPVVTIETTTTETAMSGKEGKGGELSFAEKEAELARREAELADKETALSQREAAATTAAKKARHDGNLAFAEALVQGGKLKPAGKDLVVGIMDTLEASATVSFGEATGELTPLAAFKKLCDGAQPLISFGEIGGRQPGEDEDSNVNDIADRALAFAEEQRKAGRTISVAAAVRHVTKGN